nr:MAG TPA: hypothetical protein [Caudoviricetes sp.]
MVLVPYHVIYCECPPAFVSNHYYEQSKATYYTIAPISSNFLTPRPQRN